eukprot:scaffold82496_cov29-Tisochrysis_lutea.AAC.2
MGIGMVSQPVQDGRQQHVCPSNCARNTASPTRLGGCIRRIEASLYCLARPASDRAADCVR